MSRDLPRVLGLDGLVHVRVLDEYYGPLAWCMPVRYTPTQPSTNALTCLVCWNYTWRRNPR